MRPGAHLVARIRPSTRRRDPRWPRSMLKRRRSSMNASTLESGESNPCLSEIKHSNPGGLGAWGAGLALNAAPAASWRGFFRRRTPQSGFCAETPRLVRRDQRPGFGSLVELFRSGETYSSWTTATWRSSQASPRGGAAVPRGNHPDGTGMAVRPCCRSRGGSSLPSSCSARPSPSPPIARCPRRQRGSRSSSGALGGWSCAPSGHRND